MQEQYFPPFLPQDLKSMTSEWVLFTRSGRSERRWSSTALQSQNLMYLWTSSGVFLRTGWVSSRAHTMNTSLYSVYRVYIYNTNVQQNNLSHDTLVSWHGTRGRAVRFLSFLSWQRNPNQATRRNYDTKPHRTKLFDSLEMTNTLILENVTLNDTGEYVCTASSSKMIRSSHASLVVYGKWLKSFLAFARLKKEHYITCIVAYWLGHWATDQ